jgi:hypothetical protein
MLVDYEEGEVICPHCGSRNVEQRWSGFSAITSKKSAWTEECPDAFRQILFRVDSDRGHYARARRHHRGEIRKRNKKPSKKFREQFGHTPLSIKKEEIPWKCRRLVVGTGAYGRLPVMKEVQQEAQRRTIELLVLPTAEAIKALQQDAEGANAILHVTC